MSFTVDKVSFAPPGKFRLACEGIHFNPGTYTAIVGANGSGKTSLVESILGLKGASSVEGSLQGVALSAIHSKKNVMTKVGFQMQGMAFPMGVKVSEVINLHRLLYKCDNPELRELLKIDAIAKKKYGYCSLGERARTELYFACAHKPDYLFFDEPTRSLDHSSRESFLNWLSAFRSENEKLAIVSTSHSSREIDMATDILWMSAGQLKYQGSTQTFIDDNLGSWRMDVIGEDEFVSGATRGLRQVFQPDQLKPAYGFFGGEELKVSAAALLGKAEVSSASVRPYATSDLLEYVTRIN